MQLWIGIILLELPWALFYTHPYMQVSSVNWIVQPVPEAAGPEFEAVNDFSRPQYLFLKDLGRWYFPQRVAVTSKGDNVKFSVVILSRDEAPVPTFFRSPLQASSSRYLPQASFSLS